MKWNCIENSIAIIALAVVSVFAINSCESCSSKTTLPVEGDTIYVLVPDTTININRIIKLEHELKLTKDSLHCLKDSLGEDLVVARIKLARIKEYTKIVDNKPSQLKFYKGWIKRVLEE